MSHKASSWLASIPADRIKSGAFRVLFHLCDAHNSKRDPETACFPSQKVLMEATNLSNGGLNNALNAIESAGLIRRRRTRMPDGTKGPTYYLLGCDFDFSASPTPETGDVTNSSLEASPTPVLGVNQLQSTGDKPVIEPVNKPVSAHTRADDLFADQDLTLKPPTEKQKAKNPFKQSEFDAFWEAYPRKIGPEPALKNFKRALKFADAETILDGAKKYADQVRRDGTETKFIQHPKNWLRECNWKSEAKEDTKPDKPMTYAQRVLAAQGTGRVV